MNTQSCVSLLRGRNMGRPMSCHWPAAWLSPNGAACRRLATGMRRWALALVGLFALIGVAAAQQWVEHRPTGAGYRIEFPGKPKLTSDEVPTKAGPIRAFLAQWDREATVFLVAHAVYPPGGLAADRDAVLDGARNGGVQRAQGRLRQERRLTVDGAPARRIVFDVPKGNQVGVALIVLNGNNLYQAIVVAPAGQETAADIDRFLKSFALVRP